MINTKANKTRESESQAVANNLSKQQGRNSSSLSFADNRPETIVQRKLQEMANHYTTQIAQKKGLAEIDSPLQINAGKYISSSTGKTNAHVYNSGHPLQMQKDRDYGGEYTFKTYGNEIEKTSTNGLLVSVIKSNGSDAGIFISDNINDFSSGTNLDKRVNTITVPKIDAILDKKSFGMKALDENGWDIEQNCKNIAEHELIHLRLAHTNIKKGRTSSVKGADTGATSFNSSNIKWTINELKQYAGESESIDSNIITRFTPWVTYVKNRLDYIINTYKDYNTNAEAPAVMRELKNYLMEREQNDEKFAKSSEKLRNKVIALDEECEKDVSMEEEKICVIC